MLTSGSLKAALLLDVEPAFDAADPSAAKAALEKAEMVVAMSAFKSAAVLEVADVLLPVAPFTETSGSFVNAEGRLQSFHGVVKPLGETRPAWKVLRVMGNLLGLSGFEHETVEEVRTEALGDATTLAARLDNGATASIAIPAPGAGGLERVADVLIYATDAVVRRAPSLQATADAAAPQVGVPSDLWRQLGLTAGARIVVRQGAASVTLPAREDKTLAATAIRVAAGHPSTAGLGAMFGPIAIERAEGAGA